VPSTHQSMEGGPNILPIPAQAILGCEFDVSRPCHVSVQHYDAKVAPQVADTPDTVIIPASDGGCWMVSCRGRSPAGRYP
jgi:hypothetical protein